LFYLKNEFRTIVDREIFITLGIVWLIVGITTTNYFWMLGLLFLIIGLSIKRKK